MLYVSLDKTHCLTDCSLEDGKIIYKFKFL